MVRPAMWTIRRGAVHMQSRTHTVAIANKGSARERMDRAVMDITPHVDTANVQGGPAVQLTLKMARHSELNGERLYY